MKRFLTGIIIGIFSCVFILLITAAQPAQDDSIKYHVERLEDILKSEIEKNRENGRFQLQSLTIDRTHWHYLLDSATGDLYRLELSQTPGNSKWVLVSESNFSNSPNAIRSVSQ